MKQSIEERTINLAQYIVENKATVRAAAKTFGLSKSTVHKDVTGRLLKLNAVLAAQTREILDENKSQRHIRGGMATKERYRKMNV